MMKLQQVIDIQTLNFKMLPAIGQAFLKCVRNKLLLGDNHLVF